MNLKIAICDDDGAQREYLRKLVSDWSEKSGNLTETRLYPDARSFLFEWAGEKDFDILILDIEMPEINGIELARTVRRENSAVQIIFVTGYYDYFSDGFDVSALHYLIKPADGRKLWPVMDKAANNLRYRQRSALVSTAEADIKLPLADITFVEAENVDVIVHTVNEDFRTRQSLSAFAEQLDSSFIKVHRSFIVGLKYIKKISRSEITVSSGATVPMSRGMYDKVHAALVKYL